FQAEDGIRDFHVTGVQTCALPISVVTTDNFNDLLSANSISFNNTSIPTTRWERVGSSSSYTMYYVVAEGDNNAYSTASQAATTRTEERRVGREGQYRREKTT